MSDKYVNDSGLQTIVNWIKTKLGLKQDTLVSGTNIKTINNNSLLGSGNINITSYSKTPVYIMSDQQEIVDEEENALSYNDIVNIVYNNVDVVFIDPVRNYLEFIATVDPDTNTITLQYGDIKEIVLYPSNNTTTWLKYYKESDITTGILTDSYYIAEMYVTALAEIVTAIRLGRKIYVHDGAAITQTEIVDMPTDKTVLDAFCAQALQNGITIRMFNITSRCIREAYVNPNNVWSDDSYEEIALLDYVVSATSKATDTKYGTVKTNSAESITLNSNGQLDVGGRLGAFSGTTGIFHSKDREPRSVKDFSFLITDAKGMNLDAPRDFALATGVNLTLTGSHAAGSTTYTVTNTYVNRIACAVLANGGYVSQSEAYSKENQIVPVTSVKINGSTYIPTSAANDSTKPITITVPTTANPTSSVTQLRVFGGITGGYCSEYVGQCVGGSLGASLAIGQRVYSSNNVNCIVAADVYNTGNGSAIFGRQHINRKNRAFLAGTGHDTTNARSESVSAVGEWSDLSSNEVLFAVGDGSSHTARSNAFEVRDQAIVLKSPNGTKYKVTVSNTGVLTTTAI